MKFMIAAHSDIGVKRESNQDALLVKVASTKVGDVCLCVLCDGMGGLAKGELASATVIRRFEYWFEHQLAALIQYGVSGAAIKAAWMDIVQEENQKMMKYALENSISMGTTVVALLIIGFGYYGMNIGDSRIYKIDDRLILLTKDQTVAQYQLDMGIISTEEAGHHPGKHILMQCIGASDKIIPEFFEGTISDCGVFALASDGFVHKVTEQEIFEKLNPKQCLSEHMMKENAIWLAKLSKQRHETDNLSVALVRADRECDLC